MLRHIIAAVWRSMFQFEPVVESIARVREDNPAATEPVFPDGWPKGYTSLEGEPGRYVVVIRGVATSAPRFFDVESARRDAWERSWSPDVEVV